MSYSSGIFGCFEDCNTCILGTFCPCYVLAKSIGNNEPGDGANTMWMLLTCCCGCFPCAMWISRNKVQEAYKIEQGCLTKFLLCMCVLCGQPCAPRAHAPGIGRPLTLARDIFGGSGRTSRRFVVAPLTAIFSACA